MLQGKCVVLGVTGSIAAYKIAGLASSLKRLHAHVEVLMTKNATNFINPITFETLTGNKCLVDTFDRNFSFHVEHVSVAKKADVLLIAPASANVIGKLANGIADDMLTTTAMACKCKKILALQKSLCVQKMFLRLNGKFFIKFLIFYKLCNFYFYLFAKLIFFRTYRLTTILNFHQSEHILFFKIFKALAE